MKISYIKDWDEAGHVITQLIRCENESENILLMSMQTRYIQKQNEKLYSIGLTHTRSIRGLWDKRVLYRNTFLKLY
jgi:hypothetical protein